MRLQKGLITLVFFFAIIGMVSATSIIIDNTYWELNSQQVTNITYDAGSTYNMIFYMYSDSLLSEHVGKAYDIDIREVGGTILADSISSGVLSSSPISGSWTIPESTINKTIRFKINVYDAGGTNIFSADGASLEVLQGATSGTETGSECETETCGNGICSSACGETVITCSADCVTSTCVPFTSAQKTWQSTSGSTITSFGFNETAASNTVKLYTQLLDSCVDGQSATFTIYRGSTEIDTVTDSFISGGIATADWSMTSADMAAIVNGNTIEYQVTTNSTQSGDSTSLTVTNITTGGGETAEMSAQWMDQYRLTEYTTLTLSTGNPATTVSMVVDNIGDAIGTQVDFTVYENTNQAITYGPSNVLEDGSAYLTWDIDPDTLTEGTHNYYFKIIINGVETSFSGNILTVTVDESVICDISSTTGTILIGGSTSGFFESPSGSATATMSVSGIVGTPTLTFNVYDIDSGGVVGTVSGVSSSGGSASTTFTLNSANLGDETGSPYYLYYTIEGCTGPQIVEISKTNLLMVEVTNEDIGGATIDLTNANAQWINGSNDVIVTSVTYEEGQSRLVKLNITNLKMSDGTDVPDGTPVEFYLKERDKVFPLDDGDVLGVDDDLTTLTTVVSGGSAEVEYTLSGSTFGDETESNGYEFYFDAKVGSVEKDWNKDNELTLTITEPEVPMDISNSLAEWRNSAATTVISELTVVDGTPETVKIRISGIADVPAQGATINVEIYEKDALSSDAIRTGGSALIASVDANGNATATLTLVSADFVNSGTENDGIYEFYPKVVYGAIDDKTFTSVQLDVTLEETSPCDLVDYCRDYEEEGVCIPDGCNVAPASVPTGTDCDAEGTECLCLWDNARAVGEKCFPAVGQSPPGGFGSSYGFCLYNEDTGEDDCSDSYLSYSWTAEWQWASDNFIINTSILDETQYTQDSVDLTMWHLDPDKISVTSCQPGFNTIPCPAKVQLPGFNWKNLVIAIIFIGLIYLVLNLPKIKKKNSHRSVYPKSRNSGAKKKVNKRVK